jgi:hypothetical protein
MLEETTLISPNGVAQRRWCAILGIVERGSGGMNQIRHDFATHDFKAWFAQLIQRVEQMHLPKSYAMERIATWRTYFEKGYSPREAAREEVAYEAARRPRPPQVHRSSA